MKRFMNIVLAGLAMAVSGITQAADWPQWRGDAQHSAYTPVALPANLNVQWTRAFSPRRQVWPSPLNQYLMQYDRQFEPVVMDGVMVLAFNDADKVEGIDVESGKTLWTFFTDGPVRLASALWQGKAYISCDDGFVYCIKVKDGSTVWTFDAAPDRRHVLGNRRVISMWPVRGGAVVEDGRVYFSAGIWPFMGVFLYCIDAETGQQIWINDYSAVKYRPQPHEAKAFAGIAPQGVFSVTDQYVLAACGRSTPGAYDKQTGEEAYYFFSEYSKNDGGDFVAVQGDVHYVRARDKDGNPAYKAWNNATGKPAGQKEQTGVPVLADGFVFRAAEEWAAEDAVIAGETAYVGGRGFVAAIDVATTNTLWKKAVDGTVVRLLPAADRLFAVTREGRIICLGSGSVSKPWKPAFQPLEVSAKAREVAQKIAGMAGLDSGYALVWGIGDGTLLEALATEAKYAVVVVDPSADKVAALRKKLDAAGLYGDKVSVHCAPDGKFDVPPYTMSVVVVNGKTDADLWEAVRPYGGLMLADGKVRVREGALEGAADWTHNYADAAQTAKSDDRRVKMPMAPLWWGGEAPNTDVLPRHGHGPGELVVGGRLFIQGIDCLSARDVYTGRLLWKRDLPGLNQSGLFYDDTFMCDPMAVGYNQIHMPGSNTRGANYAATADRVYLIKGTECLALDTVTGETLSSFKLPNGEEWGYIGVQGNLLIAGGEFVQLSSLAEDPEGLTEKKKVFASQAFDFSSSKRLYILDRLTGRTVWKTEAEYGFLHNAICVSADTLFCIDRYPFYIEAHLARRGETDPALKYVLRAFDLKTGREKWNDAENIFGTFLSFSQKHNALVMSLRPSADGPEQDKNARIAVYDAASGKPVWDHAANYSTFPLVHNDLLFTLEGAWKIADGSPLEVKDPVTGKTGVWGGYELNKGCNYPVASEYMLTYRASSASFYDLQTMDGTGSFGGFKSGCSATLIAADGVLNAPDYTFTCSCAFQTQSSLALVHESDVDYWTGYSHRAPAGQMQRYALNFGAPGDRRFGDIVWLNYPNEDGASDTVPVRIDKDVRWIAHHPFRFGTQELRWVYSSCLENAASFEMALGGTDAAQKPAGKKKKGKMKAEPDGAEAAESAAPPDPFKPTAGSGTFTVRLYFAEPENLQPGDRVFDVLLEGKKVLPAFDVVKAAGAPRRGVMKEFRGIKCAGSVKVGFASATERGAILSGIELIRE